MNVINEGIILLIKSAITGSSESLPEGFSLEMAMPIILRQNLETLAYKGALSCGIPSDEAFMQKLLKRYYLRLVCDEKQMFEINNIFEAFEKNGIDYLPIKGCVLKKLYPAPELRPMGDADVLIRMDQYQRIVPIMRELKMVEVKESHHELVWKSDNLYLELHKYLFEPAQKDLYPIYGLGWDRSVRENGHRFSLSNEDTFIYLFIHMTKHYRKTGIGCRHFIDLYVFRKKYPQMDEQYIENMMANLHLLEFYRNVSRLLEVWFEGRLWDEKTTFITEFILSGGNWGNLETWFLTEHVRVAKQNHGIQNTKVRILVRAFFPPLYKMQNDYRVLRKYPKLYPLFWIPRLLRDLLCRPKEIARKFAVMMRVSDDEVMRHRHALEYVGLNDLKGEGGE